MKVAMIGPHPLGFGGVQTHVKELSQSLTEKGIEVVVISHHSEKIMKEKLPFKVFHLDYKIKKYSSLFFNISYIKSTKDIIEKQQPDIIQGHYGFYEGLNCMKSSKKTKIPYILSLHGAGLIYDGIEAPISLLVKKIISNASHIISTDKEKYDYILNNNWKEKPKMSIIPTGVFENPYYGKKKSLRREENFSISDNILLFVGSLSNRKHILDILKISKGLKNNIENFFLIIIGDGKYRKQVEETASKNTFIRYLGGVNRDTLLKYYIISDVFTLPSDFETTPTTILEAMVAGLPVVATDVGGIPLAVKHNRNGYLISVRDFKNLQKYIIDILNNDQKYRYFSKESLKLIRPFLWKNRVKEIIEIYNKVVEIY